MIDADDLPAGWVVASISELCELNPKHPPKLSDDTEISFVPMAAVSDTEGRIVGSETRKYGQIKKGYTHFADGDVIFAKITPCMENGKAASVRGLTNGFACGTTEFFVLRSRGVIDQDYLFYFIRQETYRKAARATMQSGVGQARVPKEFVLGTEIPVPPLAEQRRIVARLETLQARTRTARQALAAVPKLLEQYRQSVLAAAFRGDLTAAWRETHPNAEPASVVLVRIRADRRKQWEAKNPKKKYVEPEIVDDADLPDLPEGWLWESLDSLCSMVTSGSRDWSKYYDRGKGTFIMAQNIRPGRLDFSNMRQLVDPPVGDRDRARSQVADGDLLITAVGANTGDVSPVVGDLPEHFVCQSVALLRLVDASLQGLLLRYLLPGGPGRKIMDNELIYGQGRPHLGFDDLKTLPIPIPPSQELTQLLKLIKTHDRLADRFSQATDPAFAELEQVDQSLLAQAFRGELVPQDPADEPASVLLARLRGGTVIPRQPITPAKLSRFVLMLLHNWNGAASRELVDRGILLMMDDDLRSRLLGNDVRPKPKKRGRKPAPPLVGLPNLLGEMLNAGFIRVGQRGQVQTIRAADTDKARQAYKTADATDLDRLQQSLRLLDEIDDKLLTAELAEAFHGQTVEELVSQ